MVKINSDCLYSQSITIIQVVKGASSAKNSHAHKYSYFKGIYFSRAVFYGLVSLGMKSSCGIRGLHLLRGRLGDGAFRTTRFSGVKSKWLSAIPTEMLPNVGLPMGRHSANVCVCALRLTENPNRKREEGENEKKKRTAWRVVRVAE